MRPTSITPEECYTLVVEALLHEPIVTQSKKKGFGSSALTVNDKIFAMLSSKGQFVVKLPRQRVDQLIGAGEGERFDPGHGRLMKEWFAITSISEEQWLSLAKEALEFAKAKR